MTNSHPRPGSYTFNLESKLLVQFKAAGIDAKEAVVFFGSTIKAMMSVEPNYGPQLNNKKQKYDHPTWIMRGYYPGSYIYFRITMLKTTNNPSGEYFARVISPTIHSKVKAVMYTSNEIDPIVDQKVEKTLLGDNITIDEVWLSKINLPKCISPKGMPKYSPPSKQ